MSIGITMGDPNGVGPEIILKAYRDNQLPEDCFIIGDMSALQLCCDMLGFKVKFNISRDIPEIAAGVLNVLDMGLLDRGDITPGVVSEKAGRASYEYVVLAACLALEGKISAMVTLPVNKEAVSISHPGFTGHTELIAGICNQKDYTMMLSSEKLTVTHVTTHVSMVEAIKLIKCERVHKVIKLTNEALATFTDSPRIAVAGFNAHAGEHGLFGSEEENEIRPAVDKAKGEGINITGPVPPDTVFLRASRGEFDAVVCMYHDQGHIPMKLLDFEGGVNITLGLPITRTSVDHGTAFDIAYKGKASTKSLIQAIHYALKMTGAIRSL